MKRKKGLALITTLMVMSLLLTLIGAFIQVERANQRLTGNALERRAAQDACLTALSIAWNHLEEDPTWGTTPNFPASGPTNYPALKPTARIQTQLVGGKKILHGSIQAEGDFDGPSAVTFDLTIYNNLANRLVDPHGDYSVPARSCRMMCIARSGSAVRRMDTILRQVPISYDSLVSKNKADLSGVTGLIRMESRDPYVNRMRAGTDLNLPTASNVQFLKNGSAEAGKLFLAGTAQTTDSQLDAANSASSGNYMIGQGPPVLPTFDPDNFKLPDDPTKISNAHAGTYQFGGIDRIQYHPHHIDWSEPPPAGSPPGTPGDSGTCLRYQKETSTYDRLVDAEGRIWLAKDAREGSTMMDPPQAPPANASSESAANGYGFGAPGADSGIIGPNGVPVPPSTTDIHEIYPGLWANVVTAQMAIRPGYKVECNGEFLVAAGGGSATAAGGRQHHHKRRDRGAGDDNNG